MDKRFLVKIRLGDKVLYEVIVVARNEKEAMEFAYDQLELNSYAEAREIDVEKEFRNFCDSAMSMLS